MQIGARCQEKRTVGSFIWAPLNCHRNWLHLNGEHYVVNGNIMKERILWTPHVKFRSNLYNMSKKYNT